MDLSARAGERNDITDVTGVTVGHHQRIGEGWLTGSTVVIPPRETIGAADVRGGGPATRETDAMAPTTMVEQVDAVCLTGGSAYGLDAAGGVMSWLEEVERGFPVGPAPHQVVPIVPTAAIFDLGAGGSFPNRPDASFGHSAAVAAGGSRGSGPVEQGSVGAGTGARAGRLKGGVGSASAVTASGATVGALAVVNSAGSAFDPRTGDLWGVRMGIGGEFDHLRRPARSEVRALAADTADGSSAFNTTLVVVATDARLSKPECHRLCGAAHDGMARAINPVHGYTDGDIAFGLATGAVEITPEPRPGVLSSVPRIVALGQVLEVAADTVSRSIAHAVSRASSAGDLPSYRDAFPSAFR